MTHTKESLIAFEKRVADAFLEKRIRAPVHLSGSVNGKQEESLIAIFKDVRPGDWVFSTWRSHYHALLKGIPEEWVWNEILAGRSMYLMNREHRFLSSAIVGGTLPIACGVAMGIKRKVKEHYGEWPLGDARFEGPKVWVFVGDMTARTGIFHEFCQYVEGHDLPVRVVVENNGYSTNAKTEDVWGKLRTAKDHTQWYRYERIYPHVGVGKHVVF